MVCLKFKGLFKVSFKDGGFVKLTFFKRREKFKEILEFKVTFILKGAS